MKLWKYLIVNWWVIFLSFKESFECGGVTRKDYEQLTSYLLQIGHQNGEIKFNSEQIAHVMMEE